MNHCNEIPIKTLDTEAQWSFLVCKQNTCQECVLFWFHKQWAWKLCVQDTFRSHLSCLFIWPFKNCILYNKTASISIVLSWVMWVILVNDWTWGSNGNPQIYRQSKVWVVSDGRESCYELCPITCGVCAKLLVPALNCSTPVWKSIIPPERQIVKLKAHSKIAKILNTI